MEELWRDYGFLAYLGVFAWTFLEGETFVLISAAWGRSTGLVNPWLLFFFAWTGSFCGDQMWFALGRRWGRQALRRFGAGAEAKAAKALEMLDKHGTPFILGFRFIYGVRNVASVACGMSGMAWSRFAFLNFIGAGVWAGSFVMGGWYVAAVVGEENIGWLFVGVGAIIVAVIARRIVRNRKSNRKVQQTASEIVPPVQVAGAD